MANYIQEFNEYVNFIKKKLLRNTINQNYSTNLVKLGILLNCSELNNPQIKTWLLAFHKACNSSKLNLLNNKYLMAFKFKLLKISKKLNNEMKSCELDKCGKDSVMRNEKPHLYKIRKLLFLKRSTRYIPKGIQRLSSDVSIYISEALNQKDICTLSLNICNENLALKRKRFARQVKESLFKYYNDFGSLMEVPPELPMTKNVTEELSELSQCLNKFDGTIFSINSAKTLSDIEIIINNESIDIPPEIVNTNAHPLTDPVDGYEKTSSLIDDMDLCDFNVIEEWNESLENEDMRNCNQDLISSMTDISNDILFHLHTDAHLLDPKMILKETLHSMQLSVISGHLNCVGENKAISNLQQSFMFDFNGEVNELFRNVKSSTDQQIGLQNEVDDDLLCNRHLYSKPKPSIKIMNLKKPHVYLLPENVKSNLSKEILLQNIPLPHKIGNKTGSNTGAGGCKIVNSASKIEEESDTAEEELIPQSILDFSEVMNDEFDGKENVESINNLDKPMESPVKENIDPIPTGDPLKPDPIASQPLDVDGKDNLNLKVTNDNYEEDGRLPETYNRVDNNCTSIRYKRPQNSSCKSNYSIFSIGNEYANIDGQSSYMQHERNDCFPVEYEFDQMYHLGNHNNQSGEFPYNGNYRNYERGNRRLFRNFLRYTCQSNNTDRRWYNESSRFHNGFI